MYVIRCLFNKGDNCSCKYSLMSCCFIFNFNTVRWGAHWANSTSIYTVLLLWLGSIPNQFLVFFASWPWHSNRWSTRWTFGYTVLLFQRFHHLFGHLHLILAIILLHHFLVKHGQNTVFISRLLAITTTDARVVIVGHFLLPGLHEVMDGQAFSWLVVHFSLTDGTGHDLRLQETASTNRCVLRFKVSIKSILFLVLWWFCYFLLDYDILLGPIRLIPELILIFIFFVSDVLEDLRWYVIRNQVLIDHSDAIGCWRRDRVLGQIDIRHNILALLFVSGWR